MRWQMNKLGFVNFWLYDQEEFPFRNGKLLLRGNNGAGKSITTQSFIPYILDGNRRPERLDPFGSKDRKMDFYLLGNGDKSDATGYLYLEFKKPDVKAYLTLVIGMRAQAASNMFQFWGFCLCDGRRVGKDFSLFHEAGTHRVPLTMLEARNALSQSENWAITPKDYKNLVNRKLFGFQDIAQYEQFITLLIQVRAPKLSKDFRPSLVQQILNDSLQPLSDEDLSAMVDAMEKMDSIREQLEKLKRAAAKASIIRTEYLRYNQYMLGQKARAFLAARQDCALQQSCLEKEQRSLTTYTLQQEQLAENLANANAQHEILLQEKSSLMIDDTIDEKTNRLATLKNQLCLANAKHQIATKQLDEEKEKLRLRHLEHDRQRKNKAENYDEFLLKKRELTDWAGLLEWDNPALLKEELLQEDSSVFQNTYARIQEYRKSLYAGKTTLDNLEAAVKIEDGALQTLDRATKAREAAAVLVEQTQAAADHARDELFEAFLRTGTQNQEFILSPTAMESVKTAILLPDESSLESRLLKILTAENTFLENPLRAKEASSLARYNQLGNQHQELAQKRKELRATPEPIFFHTEETQSLRDEAKKRGVVCAPFYELVEFSSTLSPQQRDLLEAQLIDAGILDALLTAESCLPQLNDLLQKYPDKFIDISSVIAQNETISFAGLTAVQGPLQRETKKALALLASQQTHASTALQPDGSYRIGFLCGKSHSRTPAGFVGAMARRENLRRQLLALDSEIEECENKHHKEEQALFSIRARIALLQTEYSQMPSCSELTQMLSETQRAEEDAQRCINAENESNSAYQVAHEKAQRAQQAMLQICRLLSVAHSSAAYQEEIDTLEDYETFVREIAQIFSEYHEASILLNSSENALETQEYLVDAKDLQVRDYLLTVKKLQNDINNLTTYLNQPEIQLQIARLREITEEIGALTENINSWNMDLVRNETEAKRKKEDVSAQKSKYTNAIARETMLSAYFEEELALKLVPDIAEITVEASAQRASKKIRSQDIEQKPDNMLSALEENFRKNTGELADYQPKLEPQFEEDVKELRRRRSITLRRNGSTLPLPDFLSALEQDIAMTTSLLDETDRDLFESILTETVSVKLRTRVAESNAWVRSMSEIMNNIDTSMGIRFSLKWKGKSGLFEGELDTAKLVELLNKDIDILTEDDRRSITEHFRAKVHTARNIAAECDEAYNYAQLIRDALDFRNWYEFVLHYERSGESRTVLNNAEFNRFSGGEKAMAMYVPLFAAVSAQYKRTHGDSPRMIALDEAFAGVDDNNIESMFGLVEKLDFGYIMNSQALWGCFASVPSLEIADMSRRQNAKTVGIVYYQWDGKKRRVDEEAFL